MKVARIGIGAVVFALSALVALSVPAAFAQDDKNCSDFATAEQAQQYVDAHPGDPSKLDGDNDGFYCETQFGHAVSASSGSTGGLATTGANPKPIQVAGLSLLALGLLIRAWIRKPAKHRPYH